MVLASMAALLVGRCEFFHPDAGVEPGVKIENRLDSPVTILYPINGKDAPIGLVIAHSFGGVTLGPGCTDRDLVAVTNTGLEVGRRPPPVCYGDLWVIAPPSP